MTSEGSSFTQVAELDLLQLCEDILNQNADGCGFSSHFLTPYLRMTGEN